MRILIFLALLVPSFLWAGQSSTIDLPLNVPTPVSFSVGQLETLPVSVPPGHGTTMMKLDRKTITDPSIGIVMQVWSFIDGTWVERCAGRTGGTTKSVDNNPITTSCPLKGGSQTKVRFVTAGEPFSTTVLFQTR